MKAHGFRMTRKKQQRPQINLQQQIKAPEKLKLLVLSGSRLSTHDFMFILKCRSIIKLDLSDNQLTTIPAQFNAQSLPSLKLLYLHNNYLRQIEDIKPIITCKQLIHITIFNNPIYSSQIEHYFINVLPCLKMINDRIVLQQQKADSLIITRQAIKINLQDLGTLGTTESEVQINLPEQKKHILRLQRQLHLIKNLWVENNPIVKLQRRWRRHHKQNIKQNKLLQEQTNENSNYRQIKKIRYYFERWKQHHSAIRNVKSFLKEENKLYLCQSAVSYCNNAKHQRIKKAMVDCIRKINKSNRVKKHVRTVCSYLKKKVNVFNSEDGFYSISGISQTHRILFFKNQLSTFNDLLQKCDTYLSRECQPQYDIMPCFDYITIRPAEDRKPHNDNLYSYFISPSMRCIFLKRREIKDLFIPKARNLVKIRQVPYLQRLSLKMSQDQHLQSYIAYENISKYIQSQYNNSLLQFVCYDDQYFKMLLRVIYYSNTHVQNNTPNKPYKLFDDTTSFKFYFDKQLDRTSSAVAIQKWWRGVRTVKRQRPPPHIIVTYHRSSTLIKHFYRGLEYQHRMSFNRKIDRYLKGWTENFMIMQLDVYMELSKIKLGKQLYPGSRIMVGEDYVRIAWDYDLQVLSPHIRLLIQKSSQKQKSKDEKVQRQGDFYNLLHLGAAVSILQFRGVKYIKFTYQNHYITRKRIAYFSLLTYTFKNNGFYIKCYQKLCLDKESIINYYISLKDIYQIYINRGSLEILKDEQISLKLNESVFIFPKRTLESRSNKEEVLKKSMKLDIQFYHKQNKNSPPIKLLEELFINVNQLKIDTAKERSKSLQKSKQYIVSPSPNPHQRRKSSLPKAQISMQQLNFNNNSQQKTIQPLVNKEQILIKLPNTHIFNQTSVKKDLIFSRRKMILEHKQTAIKKFRKQKSFYIQKNEEKRLQNQSKNHNKIENQYLDKKKRERSLKEMKKHANQFIQKGNSLIKQDVMTSLIRSNIENRINKKQHVINQKVEYESSLNKRKKFNSVNSQSYISDNEDQERNKRKQRKRNHQRYKTQVFEKRREISLPRLSEDKNTTPPPMVHGVFTEQFYAIDKKVDPSAMFNF